MEPEIRTQADGLGDIVSLQTGLDCSTMPDLARQEFKQEADINILLARFGVNAPSRQPVYGEADFDLDLQQALTAIQEAKTAWATMPIELRQQYPTWQALLTALDRGDINIKIGDPPPTPPTTEAAT